MKTLLRAPQTFEFHFPQLDTLVLVEETESGLLIRATRDTFTDERKLCFLRELEAEGFLGDRYKPPVDMRSAEWRRVQWMVDSSWLALPAKDRARRFMTRLLVGAGLLLVALLTALAVIALRNP